MEKKGPATERKSKVTIAIATAVLAVLGAIAVYAQDKYSLKSPSGIAFSDFKGYEELLAVPLIPIDRTAFRDLPRDRSVRGLSDAHLRYRSAT